MNTADVTKLAVIANDIAYIKRDVSFINDKISKNFVTREEFIPIQRLVYGLVGLILLTVLGAVLSIVVKH